MTQGLELIVWQDLVTAIEKARLGRNELKAFWVDRTGGPGGRKSIRHVLELVWPTLGYDSDTASWEGPDDNYSMYQWEQLRSRLLEYVDSQCQAGGLISCDVSCDEYGSHESI